jgi:DNA-binding MarR family transcriptional regulator
MWHPAPRKSSSLTMPRPNKMRHAAGDIGPSGPALDLDLGPTLDLSSHLATRVADLANRLSRSASRYYRKRYGFGVVEWRLIMFIGQVRETRANHICNETALDKGAVSRSLAVLSRMGVVSVREDGADSRRNNVALTSEGRALHDEMVPIALDRQSELVADLTQSEIETFIDLIERLQAKVADGEPLADEPLLALPSPAPRSRPRSRRAAKPAGRRTRRRRGGKEARDD